VSRCRRRRCFRAADHVVLPVLIVNSSCVVLVLVWLYRSGAGGCTATRKGQPIGEWHFQDGFPTDVSRVTNADRARAIKSFLRRHWTIIGVREYHPADFTNCARRRP
jgi:hypothetical protein